MRQWSETESLQLYRRVEVASPPSLPGKGARAGMGYLSAAEAREERKRMGEAKWRMLGLMYKLRRKWTTITDLLPQPLSFNEATGVVENATTNDLMTWKAKINALSDDECKAENCMRGYTVWDIKAVGTALTQLQNDYTGPASIGNIIIRKSDGTYAKRTA